MRRGYIGKLALVTLATAGVGSACGGSNLTGDIAEIIMYSRALSDAERLQIEPYLNAKWAL